MRFKLRPEETKIPSDAPFKYDLLGRNEPIEVLTNIISSFEGPSVVAIDAGWGFGKTTFLAMWAAHLKLKKYPVITFNAWETDFSGDPFMALSCELANSLKGNQKIREGIDTSKLLEAAGAVIKKATPFVFRVATSGLSEAGQLVASELFQQLLDDQENRFQSYEEAKKSITDFRKELEEFANLISGAHEDNPLVIMIDELDRCRPTYAIEVLEVAKHLFSVPNIIFVLAINREELCHSIRSVYGNKFGASGYLRRFIDLDYKLPPVDRKMYIRALFRKQDLLNLILERGGQYERRGVQELIRSMETLFGASKLGFRSIEQAIMRFRLIICSLPKEQNLFPSGMAVSLVLREIIPEDYHEFCQGNLSDLDIINRLYDAINHLSDDDRSVCISFEENVTISYWELNGLSPNADPRSPLLDHYVDVAREQVLSSSEQDISHANEALEQFEEYKKRINRVGHYSIGFEMSRKRVELIESSLNPVVEQ